MADYMEWIPFIFAVFAAYMANNVTLGSTPCTATECATYNDFCLTDTQPLPQSKDCTATERAMNTDDDCRLKETQPSPLPSPLPRDCTEIYLKGNHTSGIHKIQPNPPQGLYHSNTSAPVSVYCDMDTDDGAWTVFQRRHNGLVDFYRDWEDYKQGFGYVNGDYWLGLQILHWLTSTARYELRVDLEDFAGNTAYAKYSSFQIADERLFYKLIIGDYEGTAGDSLRRHHYMNFSTRDQDHDIWDDGNCAQYVTGAWWYETCLASNLNGVYMGPSVISDKGMAWYRWYNTWKVLKKSEMKIRRFG